MSELHASLHQIRNNVTLVGKQLKVQQTAVQKIARGTKTVGKLALAAASGGGAGGVGWAMFSEQEITENLERLSHLTKQMQEELGRFESLLTTLRNDEEALVRGDRRALRRAQNAWKDLAGISGVNLF